MKSTLCAFIILAVIVGGGIYSTNSLEDFSNELRGLNESVYEYCAKGDYEKADKALDKIEKLIEEKRILIGAMIEHAEFEKIEMNFERVRIYVSEEMRTQVRAYCHLLDYQIRLLPNDYKLKGENIL